MKNFIKPVFRLFVFTVISLSACKKESSEPVNPSGAYTVTGKITFTDGTAASGVVVTDGYTCTQTDAEGKYSFEANKFANYVSYSAPSNAVISTEGQYDLPTFSKLIIRSDKKKTYDFTLTKQEVEKKFRLMTIGDIQTSNATQIKRFTDESVPLISKFVKENNDLPMYAIQFGDITTNKWELWPDILPWYGKKKLGLPMFSVIGNHDHEFPTSNNISAQQKFERTVCPVTYSFNRGDVHFIVADDVMHGGKESTGYDGGFLSWQYEWIKQDLSYVSKDKNVILCIHIPFRDAFTTTHNYADHPGAYYNEVLALLAEYKSASILAGHLHSIKNFYVHKSGGKTIQEYCLSALCGATWTSNFCPDGTPMGWDVFTFNGADLENMYFQPARRDASHQMRIYYAPDFPDFQGAVDGKYQTVGWGLATLENTYVVNIFNMTDEWKTEVFLDGVSAGSLNRKNFSDAYLQTWNRTGDTRNLSISRHYHMYYFRPKKTFKEMKVVATDQFGNRYECSKITRPGDPEIDEK